MQDKMIKSSLASDFHFSNNQKGTPTWHDGIARTPYKLQYFMLASLDTLLKA